MPTPASTRRPISTALSALLLAAASLGLQACATNPTAPTNVQYAAGQSQEAILSQRGAPSSVYQDGDNSHWFYDTDTIRTSRELLVFDSQGVLLRTEPAWTRANFQRIEPGKTTSMQLLQQFGPALSQGKTSLDLLETLNFSANSTAQTYWRYAFREYGKHFNVIVLFDDKHQVTDMQILEDQPKDLYH